MGAGPTSKPGKLVCNIPENPSRFWHPFLFQEKPLPLLVTTRNISFIKVPAHHILNPTMGYTLTCMTSATVVTDTMMDADALSTALFVMGAKKGLAFIDSLKNTECLIVDKNMSPQLSQGMKDLANFSLESFKENLSH